MHVLPLPFSAADMGTGMPTRGAKAVWKLKLKSELFGEPPLLLVFETPL